MKYILITGGAGFIASSLASKLLLNENYFIVLIDNLLTGSKSNLPNSKKCLFLEIDVNNKKEIVNLMNEFNFDFIFHYAAVVGVDRTVKNPLLVFEDIEGLKNILSVSVSNKVGKIFFSSSSEVYGEPMKLPMHETKTPLNSRLPYAIVKNLGESYLKAYNKEFGLNYTIFRFFNTYGIKQSQDFVISKFIHAALKNHDLTIYGDGTQNRTFCYIDDNIDFTSKVLEQNLLNNEVINVGNDVIVTINELANIIIDLVGSNSKIVNLPRLKEGDMSKRQPDISKMKKIIDRPLTPLKDGLKNIIKTYKL